MRNLWCLEKISILPLIISATGIVPQSLFKNLKFLDLENTLVKTIRVNKQLSMSKNSYKTGLYHPRFPRISYLWTGCIMVFTLDIH
jgi:hypothetical protein